MPAAHAPSRDAARHALDALCTLCKSRLGRCREGARCDAADPADARDSRARALRSAGLGVRGEVRRHPRPRLPPGRTRAHVVPQPDRADRRVRGDRAGVGSAAGRRIRARRRGRRARSPRRLALPAAPATRRRAALRPVLRDLRLPRTRRREPAAPSAGRAPPRARGPGARATRRADARAPAAAQRARGLARRARARLGGHRREGRRLALPARPALAQLAQGEGAQAVGVRHRRLHAAVRKPSSLRRAAARPLRRARAALRRQGRRRLLDSDALRSARAHATARKRDERLRSAGARAQARAGCIRASWRRSPSPSGRRTRSCASPSSWACATTRRRPSARGACASAEG